MAPPNKVFILMNEFSQPTNFKVEFNNNAEIEVRNLNLMIIHFSVTTLAREEISMLLITFDGKFSHRECEKIYQFLMGDALNVNRLSETIIE